MKVKVPNFEDFLSFEPIDLQVGEIANFFAIHPEIEHSAVILNDDDVPVLIIALREISDGIFESYTIFSKHWKTVYYKYVYRFVRVYLEGLDYESIIHYVQEERPWTKRMARFFKMKKTHEVYTLHGRS